MILMMSEHYKACRKEVSPNSREEGPALPPSIDRQ